MVQSIRHSSPLPNPPPEGEGTRRGDSGSYCGSIPKGLYIFNFRELLPNGRSGVRWFKVHFSRRK